jgi:putative membrane protein
MNEVAGKAPWSEGVIGMMFWYGAHWAFWQVFLMWAGMLVFWGLLIWAVYALVTNSTRRPPRDEDGDEARRILDQRLARGEIDAEEYRRLRDLIASGDRQAPAGTGSPR